MGIKSKIFTLILEDNIPFFFIATDVCIQIPFEVVDSQETAQPLDTEYWVSSFLLFIKA